MSYPNPAEAPSVTEEYSMPCAEALLASTLALMTGYVQACCDDHREVMGRKIVTNLHFLSESPNLTAHFRTLVGNLRERWLQQAGGLDAAPDVSVSQRVLWHTTPDVLQYTRPLGCTPSHEVKGFGNRRAIQTRVKGKCLAPFSVAVKYPSKLNAIANHSHLHCYNSAP